MTNRGQAISVLIVSTLAFTVCFMVWMMFGVIGIPIKKILGLNATEFGLLTATPVLTGSLIRVPLGIWTDKYGGKIVMTILMAITVPAIWLMSYATAYWHFLVIGLFVGLAGGSFSVGTPYVARWFPKNQQGFAMGVYGAGNSGSAVNKFVAPALVVAFGWAMVPQVYAVIMLITVVLFWFFSYSEVVVAWCMGLLVCLLAVRAMPQVGAAPGWVRFTPLLLLFSLHTTTATYLPSHSWEVRLSLALSGHAQPFSRQHLLSK